jgi:transmembrane sensor
MNHQRIHVAVPSSEARRARVEQAIFGQLSAMRAADRLAAIAPPRPARWHLLAVPIAAAAAIAIALIVMLPSSAPSRIVTPASGSSRFVVGDAVIVAGGDTSVEVVKTGEGVTLVLERGSVDCDVAPIEGRAPFRVVGGEVQVEVVGTRFVVTRAGPGARVEVLRGKVRVRDPGGQRLLAAGESWPPTATAAASVSIRRNGSPDPVSWRATKRITA